MSLWKRRTPMWEDLSMFFSLVVTYKKLSSLSISMRQSFGLRLNHPVTHHVSSIERKSTGLILFLFNPFLMNLTRECAAMDIYSFLSHAWHDLYFPPNNIWVDTVRMSVNRMLTLRQCFSSYHNNPKKCASLAWNLLLTKIVCQVITEEKLIINYLVACQTELSSTVFGLPEVYLQTKQVLQKLANVYEEYVFKCTKD